MRVNGEDEHERAEGAHRPDFKECRQEPDDGLEQNQMRQERPLDQLASPHAEPLHAAALPQVRRERIVECAGIRARHLRSLIADDRDGRGHRHDCGLRVMAVPLEHDVAPDDSSHGPRILASFPESPSNRAVRDLAQLGVEVRTDTRVEHIDAKGVVMDGQRLASDTVLWAAGVKAASLNLNPRVETDRAGRVRVGSDCSIPDHPNVFVAGDMASLVTETGATLPGVAPVAMQSGNHAAESILRDLKNQRRVHFFYRDKGQMATIGRSRAIVKTNRLTLTGRFAWVAWLFIHVWNLVGFRNRAAVVFQWAWNYLFSRRESRLITGALIASEDS